MALSLLSYKQIKLPIQSQIDLGYTSALVLFVLVFGIFILARILGAQRKGSRGGRRSLLSFVRWTPGSSLEPNESAVVKEQEFSGD